MLARIARVALFVALLAGPFVPPLESRSYLPVPPFVAVVTEREHEHGKHNHSETPTESRQVRSTSSGPGVGAMVTPGTGRLRLEGFAPTVSVGPASF